MVLKVARYSPYYVKRRGAIISLGIFYEVALSGSPVFIELGRWIDYGNISIEWNKYYDTLTVSKY